MKRYLIPLALAQLADVISTGLVLNLGGYETNPVAKHLIAVGGLPLLGVTKLSIILLAFLALRNALPHTGQFVRATKGIIVAIIVITSAIAVRNLIVAYAAWKL